MDTEFLPDNSINLSFAWWNTSLSPSAKPRASTERQIIVCKMVQYFIETKDIDFIALGEISETDVEYLQQHCLNDGYKILSGVSSVGRSSFDTMYIYNSNKIHISNMSNIVSEKGN